MKNVTGAAEAKESRHKGLLPAISEAAAFIASALSAVFHCILGLFKAADAIAGFVWHLLLCVALLFIVICCLYLAFGWLAGIFAG